jgi:hypothetical protein
VAENEGLPPPLPGAPTAPTGDGGPGLLGRIDGWVRDAEPAFFNGLGNWAQGPRDTATDALEDRYLRELGLPAQDRSGAQRAAGVRALMDFGVGLGQYAGYRSVPVTFAEAMSGALNHTLQSADQRQQMNNQGLARRVQLGTALSGLQKQRQSQAMMRSVLGIIDGAQPGGGLPGAVSTTLPGQPVGGTSTPTTMGGPGDHGAVIDAAYGPMVTFESGGRTDAANPKSSARGPAQFIKDTWLSYYRKLYPDTGETDDQVLAKRSDPDLNRELYKAYGNDNAAVLTRAGQPVSPATINLSHFLDGGMAAKVLAAPQNTPLVQVIGQKAYDDNRALFDRNGITTTGALVSHFNTRFPGAASSAGGPSGGAPGGGGGAPAAAAPFVFDTRAPDALLARAVMSTDPERGMALMAQVYTKQLERHTAATTGANAPVRPVTEEERKRYGLDPTQAYGVKGNGLPEPIGSKKDDPAKATAAREDELRGQFLKIEPVVAYNSATSAFANVRRAADRGAAGDDPVADANLIVGTAKLFDPTTGVLGGEQRAWQLMGGLFPQIAQKIEAVQGGGTLPPEIRKQIVKAAEDRLRGYWDAADPHVRAYRNLSGRYPGLNADNVVLIQSPEELLADANKRSGVVSTDPVPPKPGDPPKPPDQTVPPQGWDYNATVDRYAKMSAEEFGALNTADLPPYEVTIAVAEARKRAGAKRPR